jgi:ComF family protein
MLAELKTTLIDAIYPPRCLACHEATDAAHGLCPACWRETHFVTGSACTTCGAPLIGEAEIGDHCENCEADPPAWDRGAAVFLYRDAGRRMVLAFKHGDRLDMVGPFAGWMAHAGAPLLNDADLFVPVPLHWRRLFTRRYNQSAELARALSRRTGIPAAMNVLTRQRFTPPQQRLGRTERLANQSGAFQVPVERARQVADRRIILIDDVLTTGATLAACTTALRAAGAAEVRILVLARVAFGDAPDI